MISALFFSLLASCSNCGSFEEQKSDLMLFISFSVPVATWKDLSLELEERDGSFVVRGFPENSFPLFFNKVVELRKEKVFAPIDVNPDLFEHYHITEVPALVVKKGAHYDKVVGNVRLEAALQLMKERGEVQ